MRYVIVGAGGVGGVIGGLLADAGREVALVARGAHGDAIARDGLVVRRPDRELRLRLPVAPTLAALGPRRGRRRCVLAVKSQQTAGVLEDLGAEAVDGRRADGRRSRSCSRRTASRTRTPRSGSRPTCTASASTCPRRTSSRAS